MSDTIYTKLQSEWGEIMFLLKNNKLDNEKILQETKV